MLPKAHVTARGLYLQKILDETHPSELNVWPALSKDDYLLIGALVVLYSYADMNLRRVAEVLDHANLLLPRYIGKTSRLNAAEVSLAVQSAPKFWSDTNITALKHLEDLRSLRNLVAHFAIRRFPEEDAFLFVAKSARDYRAVFGTDPGPGALLTAVIDCEQIRSVVRKVEELQNWLATVTPEIEKQQSPQ